jgi:hypothetical protein
MSHDKPPRTILDPDDPAQVILFQRALESRGKWNKNVRSSKYNNRKVFLDNILFDSKKEADHYLILKDRLNKGEILDLRCHVTYPLEVNGHHIATYEADFVYYEAGLKVVDVKGVRMAAYKLKKALMFAIYGITILEV